MKKQFLMLFTSAILITSCGPSKEEQASQLEKQCIEMLNDPVMQKQYMKSQIEGWMQGVEESKGDPAALESCKNVILDKWSEAKVNDDLENLK